MDIISYTDARQNLAATMDKVIKNRDPIIITRQKAESVVMMSLEDFNSMQETMYLLGNPVNAERLRKGIANIESGKTTLVTIEELSNL